MQRHHGGEIAARAVAADGDASRLRVAGNELCRRDAILDRRRKRILRRKAVFDREHLAARAVGELAA
jgi:hypothetical protein